MKLPRIMIAAPKSGSGKTVLTCALLELLMEEGRKIAAFKCGPDYIDPMFHKTIIGVPSKNLDSYFVKESTLMGLFLDGMEKKDMAVLEGVMGLYDGVGGVKETGSSYEIARITHTPVILVLDAHGMGRSILALAAGFLQYDKFHLIKGVILNKISPHLFESLRQEIEEELGIAVLGYAPIQEELHLESRHLGLKMPGEIAGLKRKMEKAAGVLRNTIDQRKLWRIAEEAIPLRKQHCEIPPIGKEIKIAIARDEAFCFYYEDNLTLLKKYGAVLCPFSPLKDRVLPEGVQGILIGGGYPELFLKELSENQSMIGSMASAIKQGIPSIAECGGFLYLHTAVYGKGRLSGGLKEPLEEDKKEYQMAGLLPGVCINIGKLVRFGYLELGTRQKGTFLKPGTTIRGHEFHYYDSTNNGTSCEAVKPWGQRAWRCIHADENRWWGFPHLYYYSNLEFPASFLKKARTVCPGKLEGMAREQ